MQWIHKTVGDFFSSQAHEMPEQRALISMPEGVQLTFKELNDTSDVLARGMIDLGVQHGDSVAVWANNIPEWVLLFLGLSKIGAVMIPINPNVRALDLQYRLRKADVRFLFLMERFNSVDCTEILHDAVSDLQVLSSGKVRSKELPLLRQVTVIGKQTSSKFLNFTELLARAHNVSKADLRRVKNKVSPLDTFIIKFTGGLAGYSRGAMLTHFGLINNAQPIAGKVNFSPRDTLLLPIPFHYIFGFWLGLMVPFSTHTPIVTMTRYSPIETLRTIEKERCTALYGVPTMFADLLNHPSFSTFDLSSLRTGIMSADHCPPALVKKTIETMSIPELTVAYGITEVGILSQTRWDDAPEKTLHTVGQPLDGMELKIINPENGATLPPGEKGEICVRSPVILKGYYKMPHETSETVDRHGWFHTGDLGVCDEEGYFRITGRKRNLIIRGGENIYPLEVEKFLRIYPEIRDVRVVGVPSRRLGEEVFAFAKTHNGLSCTRQALREYFKNMIPRNHIPRWIKVVEEFAGETGGFVDRNKLRRVAMEELKLNADHPLEILYEQ